MRVGRYLGAADFVPVSQAHIMADTESLGVAGVEWLERLAALPDSERRVRIPTITDPRGTDFAAAARLKQQDWMLALERRAIAAFEALGVLMTDTCINYQTIMPAVRGEHMAYGDTGVVIYSNSVLGARSNFEGGPSALAAGLTGRTPRYGYHLPEKRRATLLLRIAVTPRELHDWGALGGIVGRHRRRLLAGAGAGRHRPRADIRRAEAFRRGAGELWLGRAVPHGRRHAGGAAAGRHRRSGAAADADDHRSRSARIPGGLPRTDRHGRCGGVLRAAAQPDGNAHLAGMLDGRRAAMPLLVVTSPQVKPDADRLGITARIEAAGGLVLSGMCFYQSYAREMAEANGWQTLATNSAKLVNILGGYGYRPALLSMQECVDAACTRQDPA